MYDKQGDKKLDGYENAMIRLAEIYGKTCVQLLGPFALRLV